MNRRTNQTVGSIARQLGVGIQRNDKTNLRKQIRATGGHDKTFPTLAAKQLIEFAQLAPLAFPTNPLPFRLAPTAWPVKKMKSDRLARAVSLVEFFDAVPGSVENLPIVRHLFRSGVDEIRQQRKVQMLV